MEKPTEYLPIEAAAPRLGLTPVALRARCRRAARREGRNVVAHLGADVVAYKFGRSWRVRFPPIAACRHAAFPCGDAELYCLRRTHVAAREELMGVHTSIVKKRGRNGVTRLIIDFYYTNKNGERARFVRFADLQTRAGAEREASQYHERAVLTGDPEPPKQIAPTTLSEFYESTFKVKVLPLYRKNTRIRYEALWRQRIEKVFGAHRLDAITEASLRGFARSIELEKRKAKGPVAFLRTLLREAAGLGFLETAPRLPPGVIKDAKKLPDAPALDEVEELIAKARGWIKIALALGVYAGLRSGEIRALQVGDINLDAGVIRVVRTLSDDEEEEPKGDKERIVPVAAQLATILQPAIRGKPLEARVILTRKETTPRRQHLLGRLVDLQRRLGARRTWSVHALRHAFCSHLVRVGIGVEAVRALAGHSSIRVTNRYVHATGVDLQGAMDRGFGGGLVTGR